MKKYYRFYIENFRGLSREIWLLSLVSFINRAGAMVIPFLSLYLVKDKGFTLPEVGWIMSCYGLGSVLGTYVGGKLTDTLGFYKVIVLSLLFGGLGFIALQFFETFWVLCVGVFAVIFLVDAYRPAIFVACDAYSKPENITRSITLLRLAINLGFSIGPLVGGLIIASIGYASLFWIDGFTCVLAAFILFTLLKPKEIDASEREELRIKQGLPATKNTLFVFFIFLMIGIAVIFIQYFSLMPIYYESVHGLSEELIGALLFINGFMIVTLEMPLVGWMERKKVSKALATLWGTLFLALSFVVLNSTDWTGIVIIGMIFMTLGEMIESPFSNALALAMAPKGRKGSYMGLYSMSFSFAHVVGHNGGMNMVNSFGFTATWYVFFLILLIIGALILLLRRMLLKHAEYSVH